MALKSKRPKCSLILFLACKDDIWGKYEKIKETFISELTAVLLGTYGLTYFRVDGHSGS